MYIQWVTLLHIERKSASWEELPYTSDLTSMTMECFYYLTFQGVRAYSKGHIHNGWKGTYLHFQIEDSMLEKWECCHFINIPWRPYSSWTQEQGKDPFHMFSLRWYSQWKGLPWPPKLPLPTCLRAIGSLCLFVKEEIN